MDCSDRMQAYFRVNIIFDQTLCTCTCTCTIFIFAFIFIFIDINIFPSMIYNIHFLWSFLFYFLYRFFPILNSLFFIWFISYAHVQKEVVKKWKRKYKPEDTKFGLMKKIKLFQERSCRSGWREESLLPGRWWFSTVQHMNRVRPASRNWTVRWIKRK